MKGDEQIQLLRQEAERFRTAIGFGRSRKLAALFDYLLVATIAGRQPKEHEIATSVFGRNDDFDAVQDATVRVYVHKLRRKLEEAYGTDAAVRLQLPAGEYRLVLAGRTSGREQDLPTRPVLPRWLLPALLGLLIGLVTSLAWSRIDGRSGVVLPSPLAQIAGNGRPTAIVVGDYYLVAETDGMEVKRLVREFAINSPVELEAFLSQHPFDPPAYEDSGIRYLPTSVGYSIAKIADALAASGARTSPDVVLASDLTADMIRSRNLIYVGYFSGLGPLSDIVSHLSRFETGPSFDEITDTGTGKRYVSQTVSSLAPNAPHAEYGALMSFAGPTGNHIIVLAGTRDVAVRQLTDVVLGRATTAPLEGNREALFEVTGLNGVNVEGRALAGGPLDPASVWGKSAPR